MDIKNCGYEKHVFVCTHKREISEDGRPSCGNSGSENIRNYLKEKLKNLGSSKKIRVNASGCLDYCSKGPVVVVYPEGAWYKISTIEEANRLINECL